jgi:hypothetical protein
VLDVLHDALLEGVKLAGGKSVRFADNGDDVNAGREAAHKLDVEFAETVGRGGKFEEEERGEREKVRKGGGLEGTNA